jgi:hypothetical protein
MDKGQRQDHVADAQRYGVTTLTCPQCRSNNSMYPMFVGVPGHPEIRALCANEFHREWLDLAIHPTLWKFIKYKLGLL